ncbi:MAG: aminopeptidase [Defluviitaleaceae bacterium]|nr:aminopeptidase [Defluviitaleaceae bacterium]
MHERVLEYAKLVIQSGVRLKKGQTLVIRCPVECASFAHLVAEEGYRAGAREVVVLWGDDVLNRLRYMYADDEVFDTVPLWFTNFYEEFVNGKAALVSIAASDPEGLKGAPPDRVRRNTIATGTAIKKYTSMISSCALPWCTVSVPTTAWAKKVFPETANPVDKLWDAIFQAVRVSGDGTSPQKWQEHVAFLLNRVKMLNDYHFARIIFKNSLGTNLCIELPDKHLWVGGQQKTPSGAAFIANMPTEEISTMPHKYGVNGVVYSSMPLSLSGNLVKDIKLTLKDGKIVDEYAKEGLEFLQTALNADEGARYLGEVALVPHKSTISEQGILYYNTLFDENASCHLAFGRAYPTLKGANEMTEAELRENGVNDSIVHVDFMIGTPDLSVIGVMEDGEEIPVFVNGNFA